VDLTGHVNIADVNAYIDILLDLENNNNYNKIYSNNNWSKYIFEVWRTKRTINASSTP